MRCAGCHRRIWFWQLIVVIWRSGKTYHRDCEQAIHRLTVVSK